jgi:hypothetical protein
MWFENIPSGNRVPEREASRPARSFNPFRRRAEGILQNEVEIEISDQNKENGQVFSWLDKQSLLLQNNVGTLLSSSLYIYLHVKEATYLAESNPR